LKALGFLPKFPHKVVYAPPTILGLSIPNLWNDQGIDHLTALLKHGDSLQANITGCLARDELAMLCFELSLSGSPTQYQFKKLHLCRTQTWFHITGNSATKTIWSSRIPYLHHCSSDNTINSSCLYSYDTATRQNSLKY
jgi:hypothetical protein